MPYQSEAELENKLIKKLERQGYEYIKIEDYDGLVDNFRNQIEKFNNIQLSNSEFSRIMNHLMPFIYPYWPIRIDWIALFCF